MDAMRYVVHTTYAKIHKIDANYDVENAILVFCAKKVVSNVATQPNSNVKPRTPSPM